MNRRALVRSMPFDSSLRDVLGDRFRVLPDECAKYAVTGVVPSSIATPKNAAIAALALKAAGAEGAVVVLRGAGTKMNRPPPPRAVDLVIEATKCSGIIDHAAADLTVTVGGGTTLAAIEKALEPSGQFLACDAPFAESATIGGTISANANGALRQRYGALRDLLLGARIVTSDGTTIRAGARVVKSVAGYDTHKLFAGSFGTLGLIVEATLKVAPRPERERALVARFESSRSAFSAALGIARSNLAPMAVTVHDAAAAHRVGALLAHSARDRYLLVGRCGGNRASVARQIDGILSICRAEGAEGCADLDAASTARAWAGIQELAGGSIYPFGVYAVLKVCALPSETVAAVEAAKSILAACEITAHPYAGIVFVHAPVDAAALDVRPICHLIERCVAAGWSASCLAAPPAISRALPAPQMRGLPIRLLRAVKAAFDPAGVFDPGRLPGGV